MTHHEPPDVFDHALEPVELDRLCDRIRELAAAHPAAGAVVQTVVARLEHADDDVAERAITAFQFCREYPVLALALACVSQLSDDEADESL